MDRFGKTLLKLFSFAYRSRCTIPTIVSIALMLSNRKISAHFQGEDQLIEEDEFSEEETETESEQESDQEDDSSRVSTPLQATSPVQIKN